MIVEDITYLNSRVGRHVAVPHFEGDSIADAYQQNVFPSRSV